MDNAATEVQSARMQALSAGTEFRRAALRLAAARKAHSKAEVQGSRIRHAAVQRIMAGGVSATQADKQAASDAEYAAHKDACATLQADVWDLEADYWTAEVEARRAVADLQAATAVLLAVAIQPTGVQGAVGYARVPG